MTVLLFSYGAIDGKAASKDSFPGLNFLAVAGPTFNSVIPPFRWSDHEGELVPEFRPIETFDFQPFNVTWNEQE